MGVLSTLFSNVQNLDIKQLIMWVIGGILIYLAIKRKMEPTLLLPIGFGALTSSRERLLILTAPLSLKSIITNPEEYVNSVIKKYLNFLLIQCRTETGCFVLRIRRKVCLTLTI